MKQEYVFSMKGKTRENVPGKYYVMEKCIGCTLCHELSPGNFGTNLDEGHDFVFKQPATREDEELCLKAMQSCPVDAIRDDGLGPLNKRGVQQ